MLTTASAFFVRAVLGMTIVIWSPTVSPVDGTAVPVESIPCPVADQLMVELPAVNVQLKFTDWPAAREPVNSVAASGALRLVAAVQVVQPVPVTFTPVIVTLPVLASLTTIVADWPTWIGLGVWLTVVSVVAGRQVLKVWTEKSFSTAVKDADERVCGRNVEMQPVKLSDLRSMPPSMSSFVAMLRFRVPSALRQAQPPHGTGPASLTPKLTALLLMGK